MDRKLNWKDDLPKFNLSFAKMLYMIYYLFDSKQLDPEQKKKLKEFVILENPKMFQAYEVFEKNNSLNDLLANFKKIFNEEIQGNLNKDYSKSIIHKAFESTMKNGAQNQEEEEDDEDNLAYLASPTGGLMDKKKKKQVLKNPKHKKENSESKTFISRAIVKMKNNSDSDDP